MTHVRGRILLMGLLACAALASPVEAQEGPRGPVLKVNAAEIEIGGRVQTQFNTTSVDEQQPSQFLLRRVRLEAKVKVNDVVSGKVQPDFAGDRVSVKDAYLRLTFDPALEVLAGKAHRPFSTVEMTSSTRILPVERGVTIRGLPDALDEYELIHTLGYSDRDIGVQLMGKPAGAPLGMSYAAGVFAGPLNGRVGPQDSYQYAARLGLQPDPRLKLGAAWSSRDFGRPSTEPGADSVLKRGNAFEVDAEWGSYAPGFHFVGELAAGDFDPFTGDDFTGAQGWLAYRTRTLGKKVSNLEPILRASYGAVHSRDPDRDDLGGTLLTPGLNVYFSPLNRVMLNYDVWKPRDGGDTETSFKAQFQVAF
jgi:hypothetical protein